MSRLIIKIIESIILLILSTFPVISYLFPNSKNIKFNKPIDSTSKSTSTTSKSTTSSK